MASHRIGSRLKLNNKELERKIDNIGDRIIRKYATAGRKANEELRKKYTIGWFKLNGFPTSYHTMLNALSYRSWVKQSKGKIYLYFESYVDPEKYDIEHTSLWKQRAKYSGIDATAYIVESLQWNRGIIGLPHHSDFGYSNWINSHFHQFQPLREYMEEKYKEEWVKTVRKYL